jgi:hypothetical protein
VSMPGNACASFNRGGGPDGFETSPFYPTSPGIPRRFIQILSFSGGIS